MENGFIYGLICPRTKKIKYIGLTKKDPNKRLSAHINETKYYIKIGRFLNRKHTWIKKLIDINLVNNIEIQILEVCDYKILQSREIYWIDKYRSDIINSTDGGDGVFNLSDDAKLRISKANSGEKNGMFGRRTKRTEEQKEKLSNSLKNSDALKSSRRSEEYKNKISDITSKPILVLDMDFNIVFEFKNCKLCANHFGYTNGNIANAIRFNRKIGKGKLNKFWIVRKDNYEISVNKIKELT